MATKSLGGIKTSLITLDLISKAIAEWKQEKQIYTQEITFTNCKEISLSFQNILQISNLENLVNLETLRLDNNLIMKIENLDKLVKIKWLDLSFNQITEISGLSALENLTDLSLFHNNIKKIEKGCLDNNRKLNVLSIGANEISDVKEMVNYLRRFNNLQALCVHMNTFCKDEESVQKALEETNNMKRTAFPASYLPIIANLNALRYLDWKPVTEAEKQKAKANQTMAADDKAKDDKQEEELLAERMKIEHANITDIENFADKYESDLEKDIENGEGEYEKLMKIPGLRDLIMSAKKNMTTLLDKYKLEIFAIQDVKDEIIDKKNKQKEKNETKFIEESKELVRAFKRVYKAFLVDLQAGKYPNVKNSDDAEEYFGLIKLKNDLLEIEVYCRAEFEAFIKGFQDAIQQQNTNCETATDTLRNNLDSVRGMLSKEVQNIIGDLTTKIKEFTDKQDAEEEEVKNGDNKEKKLSKEEEELQQLEEIFADGEFSTNIEKITETLGEHIEELCNQIKTKRDNRFTRYFDQLRSDEYYRNKKRIKDIKEIYTIYCDKAKKDIEGIVKKPQKDDL